ncbi:MAG: ChaN family lipoprotein [Candidatus Methylomirabilales bacterium]
MLIGATHASERTENWQTTLGRDHPLTGRIWDVAAARFIDPATLVERLAPSRFVLLGEKHDNPDHHRLQAWLLRAMLAAGRRPTVGFEMFDIDQGPAIDQHLADAPTDAAGLADAVNWDRSGWPDWALYQPIAEVALEAGLPIVATNLPRDKARAVGRKGLAAMEAGMVARLGLDQPLASETHAEMAAEIRDAHCGYASESTVEAMITVQRARDAQMAESLAAASGQDGAVLIAGFGHVRKDRGVPAFLAFRRPGATVASLTFLEVRKSEIETGAYASDFGAGPFPFDYVWFTPRVDNRDPCERFEKELKGLREEDEGVND